MFKGTVNFLAKIRDKGIKFSAFDFNPNEPGVDKIKIEGLNGDEIRSTVHIASVATEDDGRALATKVNTVTLDRIAFLHNIAIEKAQPTGAQFSLLNPQSGGFSGVINAQLSLKGTLTLTVNVPSTYLKGQVEQATFPAEHYFGLFRSARQSESPVEEFMHLYNILLMLYNDKQTKLDAFIVGEEPTVPQTPSPFKPRVKETVYTRLRNEFAHTRSGVNIDTTKEEMVNRLAGLITLTKRAIELNP